MGSEAIQKQTDSQSLLAIRDLKISFPVGGQPLPLVDGISLDIKPGRTLGLVGESGCGKSITSLSILGLIPEPGQLTGGKILFNGTDLATLSQKEMDCFRGNQIAMVFQEPMTALNPVFTVGDQIAEVLIAHRHVSDEEAWATASEMLAKVGIPDAARRAHAYPHELSGGMRQRVMIAMAMVCEPALLIADEPTTALDVTIQAQILDLMIDMQQAMGSAILFITHDLGVVSEIADDIAVMYAGKIVETGPAAAVLNHPRHPYTKALIETLPAHAVDGRLPTIKGMVPDLSTLPQGCRFADRCAFVERQCGDQSPEMIEMDKDHFVACVRAHAS